MEPDRERLEYLFGPEALDALEDYDLDDESDVMELIDRFLPLPPGEGEGVRGAVRTIAVRQILADDPPATWQAVERMRAAGLERDQVLRQLTMAIGDYVMEGLAEDRPYDPARLAAVLEELPLPTRREVAEALVAVVRAEPGITPDEHLARTIARFGQRSSTRVIEMLTERVLEHLVDGPLQWLSGDRTVVFHDTIAGRTFTRRLTEAEHELGFLNVSVDLAAFGRFDAVRLADGPELEAFSVEPGHLAWSGPDGWLDGFQPGDVLAVTAAFDPPVGDEPVEATVTISGVDPEPAADGEIAAAVRAAYERELDDDGLPVRAEDLIASLCHADPNLFTSPSAPLSDWCAAAGLERNGSLIAHDDSVWRQELLRRRLDEVFDSVPDPHWRRVIGRAVEVLGDPDASVDDVRACLDECAETEALDVLVDVLIPEMLSPEDEFTRSDVFAPGHVFDLVQRATAVARRPREVATAEYLACVLRERCGQPLVAADHLARAAEARPRLGPVIERSGWYCFDRGDARGAMRWWRELEETHPSMSTIAPLLAAETGRTKLGRNDPCWCGSGRKFKHCHQARNELPALPDRVGWLARKAAGWLEHASRRSRRMVTDLAIAWITGDPGADESDLPTDEDTLREQFGRAFEDPIIYDAALHEGGLFSLFLHERGDLLPDDERLLASAWLTVDRSVHEVVSVEPGVGMTVRNLATGDVADVRERTASRTVQVGERYCARVVPDGASNQILGGVFQVRTGHEERVLDLCAEADPFELCAWAGALAQPPRVVPRPGLLDSMVDRDAVQAALDELGDVDEATMMTRLNEELSRRAAAWWLDESVPALDGLTPRQAAADPTRREQLERLLAEFDTYNERFRQLGEEGGMGSPITFDTAALRRELGLT